MKRYQVRADGKLWTAHGPDLLRDLDSARKQVGELGTPIATSRRQHDGTWSEPRNLRHGDLARRVASLRDGDVLRVEDRRAPFAYVRGRELAVPQYLGATPAAETVNSLMAAFDPASEFAGIFVCKGIAGTSSYSDHAWGDAVDRSNGHNDALFDWVVRMASEGLMEVAYAIGSRDGKVVSASSPTYKVEPGGGDDTHLWHVHVSVVKHSGRPPCA